MRTICLHVCLLLACVKPTFGQSTFVFENYHPVGIDAPVFDSGGNRLFGNNYVAVLYGGPTPDNLTLALGGTAAMEPVPFIRIRNGQMGYFAMAGAATIASVSSGGYAWLQVRAWDLRLGQTYDEVANLGLGGYGQSELFYTFGGELGGPTLSQPLIGFQSFSLVPEPSTWTLVAVAAGFMLWRSQRRR